MITFTTGLGFIESSHLARPRYFDNGNSRYEIKLIMEGPALAELKEVLQALFDAHSETLGSDFHSPLTLNRFGSHVLTATSKTLVQVVDKDGDEYVDGLGGRDFPEGSIARAIVVLNPYAFTPEGSDEIRGVTAKLQYVQIVEVPKFDPVELDEMSDFRDFWTEMWCPTCGHYTGGRHDKGPGA
jgi:hypothetical protein